MADYLVMIFDDEAAWASADPSVEAKNRAEHAEFIRAHESVIRSGAQLADSEAGRSIRTDSRGGVAVTDGSFAEAKEVVGGYYVIQAADLDEAVAIARQIPAPFGGVEVRPIIGRV